MGKDPAFLFYPDDFLSGTLLFSDAQLGQYIKLLCLQFRKGRLRKDEILEVCRGREDKKIFEKFQQDEKGYYNQRMDEERIRRRIYTQSRRENRLKASNCKINVLDEHMINTSFSYAEHMGNGNIYSNIYSNILKKNLSKIEVFESLWKMYPKKFGKQQAYKHFEKTVNTEKELADVEKAIRNYIELARRNNTSEQYIMNGSTFFANWGEYVNIAGIKLETPRSDKYREIMVQVTELDGDLERIHKYRDAVLGSADYGKLPAEEQAIIRKRFEDAIYYNSIFKEKQEAKNVL